ncbi:MAG TPA: 5'-deoxynucleotidase [Thermoclostridium sp.]|nr:5'-deoxynucleotidase [Thermoclostridium sp.]
MNYVFYTIYKEENLLKKSFNFFAFLSRMKHITRWGLMRNTSTENIQEHSLQVAMIAHSLAIISNTYFGSNINAERVAVLAIYHDSNEAIIGDLPTPIKYYNPDIEMAYKDLEDISKNKLLSMLPPNMVPEYRNILFYDESSYEGRLVKAADRISAYIKCLEEEKAGNEEFKKAAEATLKKIHEMKMPEIDYFFQHFIQGFSLTLDELN